MKQLIMRWKNDGSPIEEIVLPPEITVCRFPEIPNAVEEWLDIVQYGLSEGRKDAAYYKECMTDRPFYDENKCFFLLHDGAVAATAAAICNPETKEGLLHMVACKEGFRGKGIGRYLPRFAVNEFKKAGMETARLTTDDFRVPAIKTYLRAGFTPDESTEDFQTRWAAIRKVIG